MAMKNVTIKLASKLPILLHSERMANPLDPIAKKIKTITSKAKGKKTDEDIVHIARLEFEGSFYKEYFDQVGPYVPSRNVISCIRDGGKMSKKGRDITRSLLPIEPACALLYEGPRTIQELWEAESFVDMRTVKIGQARMMRCRPIFHEWSLLAEFELDLAIMDEDVLIQVAAQAGKYVGLGDYRPIFGTFEVERV